MSIINHLYHKAIHRLYHALALRYCKRAPDFELPGYLQRWWLVPRNKWLNVYLHRFDGSDRGRDPHDHEYWNLSIILSGRYLERRYRKHEEIGFRVLRPGSIVLRSPRAPHKLEIESGPVWTLFITGPRVRKWGFWTAEGWVPHDEYREAA